jgi:hypothetical protein
VHRHRRTIQRWINHGMPHRRLGSHQVEIDEADLTLWLRKALIAQKSARFQPKI